jgi:hypothetical protein
MYFGLKLVASGTSLRAAARILEWLLPTFGLGSQSPSYHALRLWLLRVGLFELQRTKERGEDWVWIVDHTQQLGDKKLLLIIGLRLSQWTPGEPLSYVDVRLLVLDPVTKATGEVLCQQLLRQAEQTGVPRAIVSDGARDLRLGVKLFCERHPRTAWIYDIKHYTALLLQRELERDPRWATFTAAANRTKQQCSVTALAFLNPPQQRGKARYLNLQELLAWGTKTLAWLDDPQAVAAAQVEPARWEAKLGWLREYRAALEEWQAVMNVVEAVESHVRRQGLSRGLADELRPQLTALASSGMSRRLCDKLLEHLAEQSLQCVEDEHLPASSEVLESLIGKYKRLQGEQTHHGVTSLALGLGTVLTHDLPQTLRAAIEQVRTFDLKQWCRENLGVTVQACRRQLALFHASREQIQAPDLRPL